MHVANRILRRLRKQGSVTTVKIPAVLAELPRVRSPVGSVIIAALGPGGFSGPGKLKPDFFFPPFVFELGRNGIDTQFISSANGLSDSVNTKNSCLINIYNEDMIRPETDFPIVEESGFSVVFNRSDLSEVIGEKTKTNALLSSHGICVPSNIDTASVDRKVFSNEKRASGAGVQLIEKSADIDHDRYNTEFIDTLREYEGKKYFTTVRLLCVGRELIHAYVRARPMAEGSPSVHSKNTPLHPRLINYLEKILVTDRWNDLVDLCGRVSDVFGPGFFCHDLLICSKTGRIFVSESGFKFHDWQYPDRIHPIAAHLRRNVFMCTAEYPARVARAFIHECHRLGCFG